MLTEKGKIIVSFLHTNYGLHPQNRRIEQLSASLPSHCSHIVSEFYNTFCAFGNL